MNLKEATKILNNLVMYCRFNEEKNILMNNYLML